MAISKRFINNLEKGDYTRIAKAYNRRHKQKGETISRSYVRLIVRGMITTDNDKVREVLRIAEAYFVRKKKLDKELIAA